jgi:chromosome partitioning protein
MMEESPIVIATHVIAVGNQKGGVGKTTTCCHLAAALGEMGRRCLVWDLDMNHGATRHFGIPPETFLGTFEVLMGEEMPEDVIVTHDDEGVNLPANVHLISARRNLEKIDHALLSKSKFVFLQDVLIKPLRSLYGKYDYIFLDTAPNATTPTIAAYKAAKWFVLTAMPDPFAIAGLTDALHDIEDAQNNGNDELRLLGVVLAGVDKRTRLANTLTSYVEETFTIGPTRSLKFKTTISRSTVVPQAQKDGKTVFQTDPTHKVAEQYRALAKEIEDRIAMFEGRGEEGSDSLEYVQQEVADGQAD